MTKLNKFDYTNVKLLSDKNRHWERAVVAEGLEIKITYDSQVQGTLVRCSMQRKSYKLPTLSKILIYFEKL